MTSKEVFGKALAEKYGTDGIQVQLRFAAEQIKDSRYREAANILDSLIEGIEGCK